MEHTDLQPGPANGALTSHRWSPFGTDQRRDRSSTRLSEPTGPLGHYWLVVMYGWLAVVISAAPDVPVLFRAVVVFTFVLVGPGIPIIGLLAQGEPLEHFVLAVMASMSLATVVAEGMALLCWWSGLGGLAALAGVTTIAAALEGSRERAGQARLEPPRPDAAPRTAQDSSPEPWAP
jgi:hypothetical protein